MASAEPRNDRLIKKADRAMRAQLKLLRRAHKLLRKIRLAMAPAPPAPDGALDAVQERVGRLAATADALQRRLDAEVARRMASGGGARASEKADDGNADEHFRARARLCERVVFAAAAEGVELPGR